MKGSVSPSEDSTATDVEVPREPATPRLLVKDAADDAQQLRWAASQESAALEAELSEAHERVLEAVTAWLCDAWEQPIVRALNANAARALDNAQAFPALRGALRELQGRARRIVEDRIAPSLAPGSGLVDQALVSNVDAAVLDLVGLIGPALKVAGLDPATGGLVRAQDGFRMKAMTEHDNIRAAVQAYNHVTNAIALARAEFVERERELAKVEVRRLWDATAGD